jgi:hypothetical protein
LKAVLASPSSESAYAHCGRFPRPPSRVLPSSGSRIPGRYSESIVFGSTLSCSAKLRPGTGTNARRLTSLFTRRRAAVSEIVNPRANRRPPPPPPPSPLPPRPARRLRHTSRTWPWGHRRADRRQRRDGHAPQAPAPGAPKHKAPCHAPWTSAKPFTAAWPDEPRRAQAPRHISPRVGTRERVLDAPGCPASPFDTEAGVHGRARDTRNEQWLLRNAWWG